MTVLELRGIEKSYGSLEVLKGVDLELEKGEVYGLLGPNGAGKTTLFRTMMGLLEPDAGEVLVDGERFDFSRRMRMKLGYLPSEVSFYGNLSARENLEFFSGLVDTDPDIDEILELVGLGEHADRSVRGFSTGMKKRLGIGQSLLRDPEVMVYDEPTTGLDPEGKRRFREHVSRINSERGVTVLVSSHITREIEPMCDRFGILKDGRIAVSGTRKQIAREEQTVRVEVENPAGLEELFGESLISAGSGEAEIESTDPDSVLRRLLEDGRSVRSVEVKRENLEDVYMRVAE
jgi:ABC-2 type transport system ATP-binding protein